MSGICRKKKLALFDLDGTLFDTRRANWLCYRQALSSFGVELEYEYFARRCNGRHYTEFVPELLERAGIPADAIGQDAEAVHRSKMELYGSHFGEVRMNGHLFGLIDCMRGEYNTAVVTTASRRNCMELLDFFGRAGSFDLVLAAEDVSAKKPDPEGFLLAMEKFGASAGDTLIFEDSDAGIQAAEAAGATVFVARGFS